MIKKIYYELWVDIIVKLKSRVENGNSWRIYSIVFMNIPMTLNCMFIMAIVQRNIFKKSFYELNVDIFPGKNLDALVSALVLYLFPILLFNHFMIFRNHNYETLIKHYKYHEGKLFNRYFLLSLFVPILLVIIAKMVL